MSISKFILTEEQQQKLNETLFVPTPKAKKICLAMNRLIADTDICGVGIEQVYRAKPIETSYDGVETYAINQFGHVFVAVWNIAKEEVEKAEIVKMY